MPLPSRSWGFPGRGPSGIYISSSRQPILLGQLSSAAASTPSTSSCYRSWAGSRLQRTSPRHRSGRRACISRLQCTSSAPKQIRNEWCRVEGRQLLHLLGESDLVVDCIDLEGVFRLHALLATREEAPVLLPLRGAVLFILNQRDPIAIIRNGVVRLLVL